MATTNFVDGVTVIEAAWLNDVDEAVYNPASITLLASNIVNTPYGNIAAVNVQNALNELDDEKQPIDATLTALAGLATGADKIPYSTGTDTFGQLSWNTGTTLAASATTISSNTVIKTAIDDVIANTTTAVPAVAADYFMFEDATDTTQKKALLSSIASVGVGQTWTNVLNSPGRAIGTTYTNNSGRPIQVSMTVGLAGTNGEASFTVGGVVVAQPKNSNSSGFNSQINAIVPDGVTYVLADVAGANNITTWAELL